MNVTDWHNCYDDGWQGVIVPEAFAHPAKMAHGLLRRIIRHGLVNGYWNEGDTIGEPFGGVLTTGIVGAYHVLKVIAVELEPRFVELANQNIALHRQRWQLCGDPEPVIIQGDSRAFAELVGSVAGVVSSPPYAGSFDGAGSESVEAVQGRMRSAGHAEHIVKKATAHTGGLGYGATPGQIGALPSGNLDAVVTSPPYAEAIGNPNGIDYSKAKGKNDGLKPSVARDSIGGPYGATSGQIGALKDGVLDGAVTSPPYEATDQNYAAGLKRVDASKAVHGRFKTAAYASAAYGETDGQLGQTTGETYWQAMAQVYSQMHLAVKPGGICAIVVKDYVKAKTRVPLCDQTCSLLESLGFAVFERTRAWLVKSTSHPSLFGGEPHVTTKERKSFFRRLAEKNGSPRIDYEEVIWCRVRDDAPLLNGS